MGALAIARYAVEWAALIGFGGGSVALIIMVNEMVNEATDAFTQVYALST